jgi:hypothetical protein
MDAISRFGGGIFHARRQAVKKVTSILLRVSAANMRYVLNKMQEFLF